MLHTGFHQRIWAARDTAAVRQGACMASVMTFFFILFFGFMGMVAFARYGIGGLVAPNYLTFLSAFFLPLLLLPLGLIGPRAGGHFRLVEQDASYSLSPTYPSQFVVRESIILPSYSSIIPFIHLYLHLHYLICTDVHPSYMYMHHIYTTCTP